jgi:predicted transcriptional regulator
MKYRIYPLQTEFEKIEKAAKLEGWPSPSSFIIRAASDRAHEVFKRVYGLPGSVEFQQELVLRAVNNGCFTVPDVAQETGLELAVVTVTLHELVNAGKLVKKEIDRKRQGPKLLPLFMLNE